MAAPPPDWSFDALAHMAPILDDTGMGTVLEGVHRILGASPDDFIVAAELDELRAYVGQAFPISALASLTAPKPPAPAPAPASNPLAMLAKSVAAFPTTPPPSNQRPGMVFTSAFAMAGPRFKLTPGQELKPGDALISQTGAFRFQFQTDGNVVVVDKSGRAIWSPGIVNRGGVRATMQTDGNFVVYNAAGAAIWSTGTHGNPGAYIQMQDDGNLVLYTGTRPLWESRTWGGAYHGEGGGFFDDLASLANDAVRIVSVPLNLVKDAASGITNNPLWDIVKTGASFIPPIGTAVSIGMSTLSAVGRGASIADLGVAAVRGAIPGGPIGQAAFDIATGMVLHGQSITDASVGALKNQITQFAGPAAAPLASAATDLAVAAALGKKSLADPAVKAGLAVLPKDPKLQGFFQVGAGLAKGASADVVARVKSLVPQDRATQSALDAGMLAARSNEVTSKVMDLFQKKLPVGKEGSAMMNAVQTATRAGLSTANAATLVRAKVALVAAMRLVRGADLHDVAAKGMIDQAFARAQARDPAALAMVQLFALARRTLTTHGQMIAGAWYDRFYTTHPTHDPAAWGMGEQTFVSYSWRAPPRTRGNFLLSW